MADSNRILLKPPPTRKRLPHKTFAVSVPIPSKPRRYYPPIAGFVHAGTLARQILNELRARAENTAEAELSKGAERS